MRLTARLGASIATAGAALALSAPTAGATARFASPTGSKLSPCTQVAPCDIATAIEGAAKTDDVTIEPGAYGPISLPLVSKEPEVSIHGQAGAPRPVIISSQTAALQLGGFSSRLSYIELDLSAAKAIGILAGGFMDTVDRVIVHALASKSEPCVLEFSETLTNSVCVADAPESRALTVKGGGSVTVRGDTLEANGGSGSSGGLGALVPATGGFKMTVSMSNTIAHGTNVDLMATADSNVNTEAVIVADHSNYQIEAAKPESGKASVTPHGTENNQTAAPLFVNPGADDFHELAGSPTIAAGFNSVVNGALDLDGNPRQFGGTADIGAYQFIPGPTCQAVSANTPFGQAVSVQLQCTDALGEPVTSYAIASAPAHGSAAVNAASGALTYTPAAGYSGPDGFTFDATSSHGTGVPATATITVGAPPPGGGGTAAAPADSQPVLSPSTFAALPSGASIARAAKGTTISYTDTQAAKTTFLVRQVIGKGIVSHGKCVKPPKGHAHGRSCTRLKGVGSFSHVDVAGANRFRFTGRAAGRSLKPGSYQLVSAPTNAAGKTGPSHTNGFKIVSR